MVQMNTRINDELKRLVDADARCNQEIIKTALWREFGGQRKAALDMRIEHKDNRISQIETEIADLQQELEAEKAERETLLAQREEMGDENEAFLNACDELLADVERGDLNRIVPETVEGVAEAYGKDPVDVFEKCKERAVEQERDLLITDFMSLQEARSVDAMDRKTVVDAWGDDE